VGQRDHPAALVNTVLYLVGCESTLGRLLSEANMAQESEGVGASTI
jgi:hypothetical protein